MARVLVAWVDATTPNLGVRALGVGTEALVRRCSPDAEVVTHNYGRGDGPVNIGVPRTLLREAVLNSRGAKSWLRSFDLVIDTRQGDSFADIYGTLRLRAQSTFAEFVHHCGVPLVMGPQTIGPFRSVRGRALARRSLRIADVVMARDHRSVETAAALGRPVDVSTTDVVFALPAPDPAERRDVLVNVSGLLWSSDSHGPSEAYRRVVTDLLAGLRASGRGVSLLAHVLDSDNPDSDTPTVRALADEHGLECVVPAGLDEARAIMAGAELVVGSRMHACLNSLSVGTPAIPLAYSRKFAPLLADVGWDKVVSLSEPDPAGRVLEIAMLGPELRVEAAQVRSRADALLDRAVQALGGLL